MTYKWHSDCTFRRMVIGKRFGVVWVLVLMRLPICSWASDPSQPEILAQLTRDSVRHGTANYNGPDGTFLIHVDQPNFLGPTCTRNFLKTFNVTAPFKSKFSGIENVFQKKSSVFHLIIEQQEGRISISGIDGHPRVYGWFDQDQRFSQLTCQKK